MDRQDDPEARIRDLERPLSDTAASSEMGTTPADPSAPAPDPLVAQPNPYAAQPGGYETQPNPYPSQPGGYAPPPTLPPPTYGGGYPTAPPVKTAGLRGCWIALAVLAAVAMAVIAALVVFGAHLFSSRSAIISFPSVRPSGNPFYPTRPGNSGGANQAPTTGGSTTAAPQGGTLNVTGVSENKTIACNDAVVTITGVTNTIVLTGHCASVTVLGSKNVVTVDTTDTIDASGIENQVTFHSGSPSIQNSGMSNTVQQG